MLTFYKGGDQKDDKLIKLFCHSTSQATQHRLRSMGTMPGGISGGAVIHNRMINIGLIKRKTT